MAIRRTLWMGASFAVLACADAEGTAPRSTGTPVSHTSAATSHVSAAEQIVDSLLQEGDSLLRRRPAVAFERWSAALQHSRDLGDSIRMALAMTGMGQALRVTGDYEASRRYGEAALALKLRLGMQDELFRSYNALGLLALSTDRLQDADTLFRSARQHAVDSIALAKVEVNAGLLARDLGAFARARQSSERGRDIAASQFDSVTLGRALNNIGALDVAMGDPLAAIAGLERARRISGAKGDTLVVVNALGQLATAYNLLGNPQRAFSLLDSAINLARLAALRPEETEDLAVMAELFHDAGDYLHALEYSTRALPLTDSLPDERGRVLRNMSRAHAALGNRQLAVQHGLDAKKTHHEAGLTYSEMVDDIVLAGLAQQEKRFAEANAFLVEARRLTRTLQVPVARVYVALAEASAAVESGQWTRALRVLDAMRDSIALAGSSAEAEAFHLRSRAHAHLGQVDVALREGTQAIDAVERTRANYGSGGLRTSYAADRAAVYAQQALLLLRAGRAEAAFEVADAARGRALLEHLASARADVQGEKGAAATLVQEALLRRIDALVASLQSREETSPRERSASPDPVAGVLRDSLLAARGEYEALVARTTREVSTTLPGMTRATVADVQHSLRPRELLLEYFVTPDRLIIFAMSQSRLTTHVVEEGSSKLAQRIRLARELIQRRDQDDASRNVLRVLHGLLIAPVRASGALQGVDRLVIVPHQALTYLPFSALVDSMSGRYLVEDHEILRLPTSASLPALRDAAIDGGTQRNSSSVEVFAPIPSLLPGTRDEARSIADAIAGSRVHLGASASEREVRRALTGTNVVHVATHATMNNRNPLFSHVQLAPGVAGVQSDNGLLEVHELLGMRVNASLVFLSGCETGLGSSWSTAFEQGEDYTTIAQTLLYAGARNVIATLWRIDDRGAAAFARQFYGALPRTSVTGALARAQRATIGSAEFRSPYYWASYEVSGAGDIEGNGSRKSGWLVR